MPSLSEILGRLRGRGHTLRLCPRCGSTKLKPLTRLSGWFTPMVYVCEDCGYVGPIVAEVDVEDFKGGGRAGSV